MQAQAEKSVPLARGRVLAGRYEIESVLGEGASGVVYLAHERGRERPVAVKVIHPHLCSDRQIYKRFQREAAILKRVEGPHLVKLLDFVQEDDLLIIALEFVDATSLEALLAKRRPLPIGLAVEITLQVCAALGAAHAGGVVHRDLKPANVLIEQGDDGEHSVPRVRVVDFGLAKVLHGEQMTTGLTEHDMIFGTPEYMAPEQARGDEVDARCDIYAAGIILYEMAVGDVPFRGRTPIASMTAHLTQEPPPPRAARPDAGISAVLEAVILRALAKNPDHRYSSARSLAEALVAARDEKRVIAAGAGALDIGDTDLSLSTTGLAHSPTVPSDPPAISHAPTIPSRQADVPAGRPTPKPEIVDAEALAAADTHRDPAPSSSSGRWLWTLVAVLALALGVTIGALVGGR